MKTHKCIRRGKNVLDMSGFSSILTIAQKIFNAMRKEDDLFSEGSKVFADTADMAVCDAAFHVEPEQMRNRLAVVMWRMEKQAGGY